MDRPLVSIVVAVYNGARFLDEALRSAFAQEYSPIEVIVVNDGSEDETELIAKRYDVRYVFQPHQGVATARNTGIAAAAGEIIAFLDSDDIWHPTKINRQVAYLIEHPSAGYVCCGFDNFIEPGAPYPRWLPPESLLSTDLTPGSGTLAGWRWAFEKVGQFDGRYRLCEDTDWFMRALQCGLPTIVLPESLSRRRIHDANLSGAPKEERQRLRLKLLKDSVDRNRRMAAGGKG